MSLSINSPLNRNPISSLQLSQQNNVPAQQRLSSGHRISNDAEDTGVKLTLSKEGIAAATNQGTNNAVAVSSSGKWSDVANDYINLYKLQNQQRSASDQGSNGRVEAQMQLDNDIKEASSSSPIQEASLYRVYDEVGEKGPNAAYGQLNKDLSAAFNLAKKGIIQDLSQVDKEGGAAFDQFSNDVKAAFAKVDEDVKALTNQDKTNQNLGAINAGVLQLLR